MSTTFMTSPKLLFTSESVTEGHPDKVCDQISDGVLDAVFAQDPYGRVACEAVASGGLVGVFGEITTTAHFDAYEIVKNTLQQIGYTDSAYCLDYKTAGILVAIKKQSPDIDMGVSQALEAKAGDADPIDQIGAGDQGMMIGFACNETEEYMPWTISLAHKLAKQLTLVRKNGTLPYLGPDGKSQVTVEYARGKPVRVDAVVISTQHLADVSQAQIARDVRKHVIDAIVPAEMLDVNTKFFINPTGRFNIGGPMGDAGLTGRKIIVDTYGGVARHGGGAFSGKDPTKVDRSAAYAARYVAKNVVAAGLAERFELQVAYAIGVAHPVSINAETFGTEKISHDKIMELVRAHFDLRPAAIIRDLNLRRPIYQATAAYGHFGRHDIDAPWEAMDKAEILRADAGLNGK
ncbi:MAG: S-adenosylmethionine synthase [Chloroflexota bacterium]|nr:MAG: S-adenosylmethionine synthase [Chloroflexota bacterium]